LDRDGRDIIVLLDKKGAEGAGHMAALIGNDKTGWQLYSKNGATNGGPFGPSTYQAGEVKNSYDNFDNFLSDERANQTRYDVGFYIKTTPKQDQIMRTAAEAQVKSDYDLTRNSCADTPSVALLRIGRASGIGETKRIDKEKNEYILRLGNVIPNFRYDDIKSGNKDGTEINLNILRQNKD